MNRRTLLAVLCVGSAGMTAMAPQPVHARRQFQNVAGSYFGLFTSSGGDVWNVDLTVTQQIGSHLDARMDISALFRDVPLTGSCNSSSSFTLVGSSGYGRNVTHFKLRGQCHVGSGGDDHTTFQGTYVATGARREKGTFLLSGQQR